MNGRFTFPKNEKLCYKKHIDRLFIEGKSFTQNPLKIYYLVTDIPENPPPRVVIAVPRKKFRRAVDRNRIRRLIREAYRLNKHTLRVLTRHIHIGIVYIGDSAEISFSEIEKGITGCMDKLVQKVTSDL